MVCAYTNATTHIRVKGTYLNIYHFPEMYHTYFFASKKLLQESAFPANEVTVE